MATLRKRLTSNASLSGDQLVRAYRELALLQQQSTVNRLAVVGTILILLGWTLGVHAIRDRWIYPNLGVNLLVVIVALIWLFGIKIADHWQRVVVLRLGRFHRLAGPGRFWVFPVLERVARVVDMRVRSTDFRSESTLTKDTVPVNVDAICFWMVWDARKAVLEVEDYMQAIVLSAQTALRDIISTHNLSELLTHREALGKRLQEILDAKTNPWGITIQSVEIRDIILPPSLEDAMSKEAQAERERHARIILGTAETEIAEKFAQAAQCYQTNPMAMHLRGMNMLFEGLKEKGSMVIVPSSALDSMNLGALAGLTALAQTPPTQSADEAN